MRLTLIDIASARRKARSESGALVVLGTSHAVLAASMYGAFGKYVWIFPPICLSMPGKKLFERSILFCRKFCSDAVFVVLWMSTRYFMGIRLPSAFSAHQPLRRFHCRVCDDPLPAP